MQVRTAQDLLAERRNLVDEQRQLRGTDRIGREMLQWRIDEIDRNLAERKIIAAGVLNPPVTIPPPRDAIGEAFDATRETIAQLEAERDARELVHIGSDWSPSHHAARSAA